MSALEKNQGAIPPCLALQKQIRENAAEMSDYFKDLSTWETSIQKKEKDLRSMSYRQSRNAMEPTNIKSVPSVRSSVVQKTMQSTAGEKVSVQEHPLMHSQQKLSSNEALKSTEGKMKADSHTYDKGYDKWKAFDVEAELARVDNELSPTNSVIPKKDAPTIANQGQPRIIKAKPMVARNAVNGTSREELEKEDGNNHYKLGDFLAAIKCYTRCLAYNPKNAVVLSNRAMTYLKTKEYTKAEEDCNLALKVDPKHTKSYSRRGTARNALGRHREALLDFETAQTLEPQNRRILADVRKTREMIKSCIKRVPRTSVIVEKSVASPSLTPEEGSPHQSNHSMTPSESEVISSTIQTEMKSLTLTSLSPAQEPLMQLEGAASKPKELCIIPNVPTKPPRTSYEFTRVWNSLSTTSIDRGTSDQLKFEYLQMIKSENLPRIFKNSIESDVLCNIAEVLSTTLANNHSPKVVSILREMVRIPRFDMTLMFLSEAEKSTFTNLIDKLAKEHVNNVVELGQVENLRKIYCKK